MVALFEIGRSFLLFEGKWFSLPLSVAIALSKQYPPQSSSPCGWRGILRAQAYHNNISNGGSVVKPTTMAFDVEL